LGNSLGMHYVEVSALKNENLEEIFVKMYSNFDIIGKQFPYLEKVFIKLLSQRLNFKFQ
jgi:hypothetical protein